MCLKKTLWQIFSPLLNFWATDKIKPSGEPRDHYLSFPSERSKKYWFLWTQESQTWWGRNFFFHKKIHKGMTLWLNSVNMEKAMDYCLYASESYGYDKQKDTLESFVRQFSMSLEQHEWTKSNFAIFFKFAFFRTVYLFHFAKIFEKLFKVCQFRRWHWKAEIK